MELQIWEGDWGLPSIDHDCLAVLAYSKFLNLNIDVKKVTNYWKLSRENLPILSYNGENITTVKEIFDFLKTLNASYSQNLKSKENADSFAFTSLMEEKLSPALLYLWWVDDKTYVELTRPWYAGKLLIPFSWYLPIKRRLRATEQLESASNRISISGVELEAQLMKDAKECLNLLSTKLGEKQFFFGDKPSVVDALAFGYLAPLLNAPLPTVVLQNHLKACRNLVMFCRRIQDAYFPLSPEELEKNQQLAEEARQKSSEDSEFQHKRRNMVAAVALVAGAMLGYALLTGLIQLEFINVERKSSNNSSASIAPVLNNKEDEDVE